MTVKQTFTGDAAQLNRELDKVLAQYAKLEQQMQRASDASEKSGKAGTDQMSSMSAAAGSAVSQLTNLAAGYLSVSAAVSAMTQAYQKQRELEDKSLDFQERYAKVQADLVRNAGEDFKLIQQQVEQMAQRTKVSVEALTPAASAAMSGRPTGYTIPETMGAVEAAARLMPESPQAIPGVTQSLEMIMGATGIRDARVAAGFLQSIASQSQIRSIERVGERFGPAMVTAGIQDKGDPLQAALQAGAMAAVFTKRGDPTGELARGATIGMLTETSEFFRQPGMQDPGSLQARLQALQGDERLRAQFLARPMANVPTALKTSAINFLDPTSADYKMFMENIAAIQVSAEPFEKMAKDVAGATKPLQIAAGGREVKAIGEQFELATDKRARAARAREIFEQGMEVGEGMDARVAELLGGWGFSLQSAAGVDPVNLAKRYLGTARSAISRGGVTAEEQSSIDRLDKLLEQLERLNRTVESGQTSVMAGAVGEQSTRHREN